MRLKDQLVSPSLFFRSSSFIPHQFWQAASCCACDFTLRCAGTLLECCLSSPLFYFFGSSQNPSWSHCWLSLDLFPNPISLLSANRAKCLQTWTCLAHNPCNGDILMPLSWIRLIWDKNGAEDIDRLTSSSHTGLCPVTKWRRSIIIPLNWDLEKARVRKYDCQPSAWLWLFHFFFKIKSLCVKSVFVPTALPWVSRCSSAFLSTDAAKSAARTNSAPQWQVSATTTKQPSVCTIWD